MVVDAGGSTVDTTVCLSSISPSLNVISNKLTPDIHILDVVEKTTPKLRIRELKPSACVQAGAIFPTRNAMNIIRAKLFTCRYGVRSSWRGFTPVFFFLSR